MRTFFNSFYLYFAEEIDTVFAKTVASICCNFRH